MKPRVVCRFREENDGKIFCNKNKITIKHPSDCSKSECKACEFPILAEVVVKVGRCDECPYCTTKRTMGAGYAFDYMCSIMKNKIITPYVEYMSELDPVPGWCPFYINK